MSEQSASVLLMTISVSELLNHVGLVHGGVVSWGDPVPEARPGVYLVSSSADPLDSIGLIDEYSPNFDVLSQLKALIPDIAVDGLSASVEQIAQRLSQFWIPDTPILYIGLAGTSIRRRVNQYYSTKVGANSPHSGGWWLKTMTNLDDLYVHFAATIDSRAAEQRMIDTFADSVPTNVGQQLFDSERIAPFANVEVKKGRRKQHGLNNYKTAKGQRPQKAKDLLEVRHLPSHVPPPTIAAPKSSSEPNAETLRVQSQRITAKDRLGNVLRIPVGSEHVFPSEDAALLVQYRGRQIPGAWRVRYGRSSTIALGRSVMTEIGSTDRPVLLDVSGIHVTIIE